MAKIFGIDLGTTYSCIAYVDEYGKAVVVNNQDSSPVTPSVVAFEDGGNASVGQAAKEMLNSDPMNVCSTIKRQIGKRDFTFNAYGQDYSPEAISALILKKLAQDAGEVLGEEVKNVVITCPAYFGLDERDATQKAGEIAGLNVLGILNEPTAAAISYGLQVDTPQTVMVYDLGGGTFDVTIIQVSGGSIQVVATGGDHMLGGKDWDESIRDFVINQYVTATGENADDIYGDLEIMGDLELKAETAKKNLSQREKTIIKLNGEKVELTRDEFDQRTSGLLESTIAKTRETLDEAAKKGITQIDKILLVGGSTRMLQVEARLKQEFPTIPIEFCDPDQSVAKGAALYGINKALYDSETHIEPSADDKPGQMPQFSFAGGKKPEEVKIVNVISQSVAVRLFVGEFNELRIVNQIYKNTSVPCEQTLHAGTQSANQDSVFIEIFENGSPDEYVAEADCKELVSGELGPLPANLPAGAPIDVIFKIDDNGLLSIDAYDVTGGATKHLEVSLKNSLSQQEMEQEIEKVKGLSIQ